MPESFLSNSSPSSDADLHTCRALLFATSNHANLLRQKLGDAGCETNLAPIVSPTETQREIAGFAPDLIVIEATGAEAKGAPLELVRWLRNDDETFALPIAMLFQTESNALREAALKVGVDDFFSAATPSDEMNARLDALRWRVAAGRRAAPIIGERTAEIENFLLLLDTVRGDITRMSNGTLALVETLMPPLAPPATNNARDTAQAKRALVTVLGFFKLNLRRIDAVGFYGPTTLLVYFPRRAPRETVASLTDLRDEFLRAHANLKCDLAIGIASFPEDGRDVETIIAHAEKSLTRARQTDSAQQRIRAYRQLTVEAEPKIAPVAKPSQPPQPIPPLSNPNVQNQPTHSAPPNVQTPAPTPVVPPPPHELTHESPPHKRTSPYETPSSPSPASHTASAAKIFEDSIFDDASIIATTSDPAHMQHPPAASKDISKEQTLAQPPDATPVNLPPPTHQAHVAPPANQSPDLHAHDLPIATPKPPEQNSATATSDLDSAKQPTPPNESEVIESEAIFEALIEVDAEPSFPFTTSAPTPATISPDPSSVSSPPDVSPISNFETPAAQIVDAPPASTIATASKQLTPSDVASPPVATPSAAPSSPPHPSPPTPSDPFASFAPSQSNAPHAPAPPQTPMNAPPTPPASKSITIIMPKGSEGGRVRSGRAPRRLLLIVSNQNRLAQLNLVMRAGGYETRPAFDGVQGLNLLRIERPDVLVVDYELNGPNGFDVINQMWRQNGGKLPLPVILLLPAPRNESEAQMMMMVRRAAHGVGVQAVVGAPFEPNSLLECVRVVGTVE